MAFGKKYVMDRLVLEIVKHNGGFGKNDEISLNLEVSYTRCECVFDHVIN